MRLYVHVITLKNNLMAKKPQPVLPEHPPQKIEWVVFVGSRKLCPIPWKYKTPDLTLLKNATRMKVIV